MTTPSLERITVEPKSTAQACVIWLHGLGDSGAGFAPIVPALKLPADHNIRFIFPHAPDRAVTINNGHVMKAWYDIKSMDLHNRADMTGVLESEASIHQLIEEQVQSGIPSDKIILAGFSQGGVVSLFTGLRFSQKLAGIMALSCYLPNADKLPENLHEANKTTSILQNHGNQDEVVLMSSGKMANKLLVKQGYNVEWKTYNMPHSVLPEQIDDISLWIQKQLA
ncbi:alpha/beta hydrolase [Pseudocolwellia sp. HL-MZ19]|uniref:alpha/beta hydrolase n=1 Tax=Pseudocolwellia sp. HL-MZ19 TaxID=3400846 RepID=UPI003CF0B577